MIVSTTRYGTLNINVPPGGLPSLRLLKWHAPDLRVECTDEKGVTILVPLLDIDISHEKVSALNSARLARP